MDVCVICEQSLSPSNSINVYRKGLDTLIKASNIRGDGKAVSFENKNTIELHEKCRRDYTRSTSIKAYQNASKNCQDDCNQPSSSTRRSTNEKINFKTDCLFCGKNVNIRKKVMPKVCVVSTLNIKDTIVKHCLQRNDEWGQQVRHRIDTEIDLVAAEARYHRNCYGSFTHKYSLDKGRPLDTKNKKLFSKLCAYIDDTKESICQFTMTDLLSKLNELADDNDEVQLWTPKYIKQKLLDHYKEELLLIERRFHPVIFCFKGNNIDILDDVFINSKLSCSEKREKIILSAAKILKEEIRSKFYILDEYPTAEEISKGGIEGIPNLLLSLLSTLIGDNNQTKNVAIANTLIAAVRPRSYISPVLFGTGVHLHRKYGSKNLIDYLSALGFSVSYKEITRFEASAVTSSEYQLTQIAYQQFVFDNADFNIKTIDGYGTFHCMGGIVCISPSSEVCFSNNIVRPKNIPTSKDTGKFGYLPLKPYKKKCLGLKNIKAEHISFELPEEKLKQVQLHNCLWMASHLCKLERRPSWNGFMSASVTGYFETSCVLPIPFINLEPSNLTTIHSALQFAANQSKKQGQKICFVTFDQPLYIKAVEMVLAAECDSDLKSLFIRLGGFHMLMSFLGSIGYLMMGSGLEEMWNIIYAKNSIPAMINGHSFSRAIRAHFLTQLVLSLNVLKSIDLDDSIKFEIEELYSKTEKDFKNTSVEYIWNELQNQFLEQSQKSRTAKLWVLYWDLVDLVKMFIRAERMGDLDLHLYCVHSMIPIFHATGHLLYAKSSHIYFQQIKHILTTLDQKENQKFRTFFTVRRTNNKLWSGVWTDMTIEQVLMRSLKAEGGLTRGRGLTQSTLAKWVSSMPECSKLSEAAEDFSGTKSIYSEQHVELRDSREQRDRNDVKKLLEWVSINSPFNRGTPELMSLASGMLATEQIDCDLARETGMSLSKNPVGQTFNEIKLKRSSKVKNLSFLHKTVKLYNQSNPINPSQLFNRILCTYRSQEDLKECFCYELAPYPLSLFDNGTFQKTKKSALFGLFDKLCTPSNTTPKDTIFVIDGGYLLHKVIWQFPATYKVIYNQYINYILYNYGQKCVVVFDGYEKDFTTKNQEQLRRYHKNTCSDVKISEDTMATINQTQFFSNKHNKSLFIKQLSQQLKEAGVGVFQAEGDADTLIVHKVLELGKTESRVTLVGEDTDLMVLLLFKTEKDNIFMLRPGQITKPNKITNISSLQNKIGVLTSSILFCHAISGCDSTSAIYKKGKLSTYRLLEKNPELRTKVAIFLTPNANKSDLISVGEEFLLFLYGAGKSIGTLDHLRFVKFHNNAARQSLNSNFSLASLPPTSDAASNHSLRVYHQIQAWLGNELDPTSWGWKKQGELLVPTTVNKPIAPDFILKLVFCNCRTDCGKLCSCRKAGLDCSNLCGQCQGQSCSNVVVPAKNEDDHEEECV